MGATQDDGSRREVYRDRFEAIARAKALYATDRHHVEYARARSAQVAQNYTTAGPCGAEEGFQQEPDRARTHELTRGSARPRWVDYVVDQSQALAPKYVQQDDSQQTQVPPQRRMLERLRLS